MNMNSGLKERLRPNQSPQVVLFAAAANQPACYLIKDDSSNKLPFNERVST